MAGEPLMDGFTIWLWAVIGDLDYYYKNLRLPNSNSKCPCAWCPANTTTLKWYDFRWPRAKWPDAVYTKAAWLATAFSQCPLFNESLGITILSVYPDWMHCKHLGIDKILLGSVLWLLVHQVLPAGLGDAEARLSFLMGQIFEMYDQLGSKHRYGAIKMTMFSSKSSAKPILKGRAAEVKCLGPVLHEIWQRYMNTRIELHNNVELVLRGSRHLDFIIDNSPDSYALDETQSEDLIVTGFGYLSVWRDLAQDCKERGMPIFGMTAKAHFLMHCCLLSRFILRVLLKGGSSIYLPNVWCVCFYVCCVT